MANYTLPYTGEQVNNLLGAVEGHQTDIDTLKGKLDSISPTVPIARGGTGSTTAADARTALGITLSGLGAAASSHSHSALDITNGTLSVSRGGTGVTTSSEIALKSYPVGAVYISYVSTSPASLFGGTWTAITGRFPYFNAGTGTGGSNTHTLTTAQMPSHSHSMSMWLNNGESGGSANYGVTYSDYGGNTGGHWESWGTSAVGGGQAHNNMPAYQTLYAWRRTA